MADQPSNESAKDAWARIESLGGHGVWESDVVVVSLQGTGVSDDDLALFSDFPYVQILDLSSNPLTDAALKHLSGLPFLHYLNLTDTQITDSSVAAFHGANPNVEVRTDPYPAITINPFTGRPFDD